MVQNAASQRVQVIFAGTPPQNQIARASGVTDVRVDGHLICCVVEGSFQPFLEALRGYEVTSLTAIPTRDGESA